MADNSRDEAEQDAKKAQEREALMAQIRDMFKAVESIDYEKAAKDIPRVTDGYRDPNFDINVPQNGKWFKVEEGKTYQFGDVTVDRRKHPLDAEILLRKHGVAAGSHGEKGDENITIRNDDGTSPVQVVLAGPDKVGAFTGALEKLAGKNNVAIINITNMTPEQVAAAVAKATGGRQYDLTIAAHGADGAVQVGRGISGDAAMLDYGAMGRAMPKGLRDVVNFACHGQSMDKFAKDWPAGSRHLAVANRDSVGWSDYIAASVPDGKEYTAAGSFEQAMRIADAQGVASRNDRMTKPGAKYASARDENVFATDPTRIYADNITVGRRTSEVGAATITYEQGDTEISVPELLRAGLSSKYTSAQIEQAKRTMGSDRSLTGLLDKMQGGTSFEDLSHSERTMANVVVQRLEAVRQDQEGRVRKAANEAGDITTDVAVGPNDKDPKGHTTAKVATDGQEIKMG